MGLPNIPDGGYDPADLDDEDEVEDYDYDDDPTYVEDSGLEDRVERLWYPGPK
jgi:hypothetical protein